MKTFEKVETVRDFLSEVGIENIFEATKGRYVLFFELFKAFVETYDMLTTTESEVVPEYRIVTMLCVPRGTYFGNIMDSMTLYSGLQSNSSNRKYRIDKSKVKDIRDYANAKIELVHPNGKDDPTYAEQAAILLLSFCTLNQEIIDIYSDNGDLPPYQLIQMSKAALEFVED